MLDDKDLQAIANLIDTHFNQKLVSILDQKLQPIKDDLEQLKETAEINRANINAILDWADQISQAEDFPLPKVL